MPTREEKLKVGVEIGLDGGENLSELEDRLERLKNVNNTKVKALESGFNDLDKRVKATNKSALELVSTISKLNRGGAGLDKQTQSATKAQLAQEKLNISARKLEQQQQKLDAQQIKISSSFDRASNSQKRADQETQRLANSQKRLEIQTQKLNSQLSNQGYDKYSKTISQIQSNIDKLGSSIESAGKKLTVGLTAPIIAAGIASSKFAGDLEESIAEISTIAPQIDTKKLNSQITDISTRIPIAANDLAAAIYNIFSSIDVNQDQAVGLAEIFAKGARAAKTDVDTFGTAILGVINAYKLDVSQASEVSDIFFNTVNKGVINGQELATNLGQVTQSAKNAGVSFKDLGAFIAAVTKEGGNAAQNVNNLNNVFSKIVTPDSQKALDNLLGKNSTVDAQGNFLPIIDVLDKLKAKLDTFSQSDKAKALQDIFPDLQARTGVLTLISQLDFLRETMALNESQAGSTEKAYQKMVATTNAQFTLLKNIAIAALVSIGNSLLPVLVPLFQKLGDIILYLTGQFNNLSEPVKEFLGVIAVIAAAIGPVLVVIGGIISFITPLIGTLGTLFSVLGTIGGALVSLGGFISSFIGLIGTAGLTSSVTALVSVLGTTLIAALGAAAIALAKVILAIVVITAVVAAVVAAVSAALYILYRVWQKNIGGIQEKTYAAFNAIKTFVISTFNQLKALFLEILPYLEQLVETTLSAIEEFWALYGDQIVSVATVWWNYIKTFITETINIIAKVIKGVLQIINGDWEGAWDSIGSIVNSAFKLIGTIIGAGVRIILEMIWGLIKGLFILWVKFQEAGTRLGEALINGIVNAVKNNGWEILAAIELAVLDASQGFPRLGAYIGGKLWDSIKSGFFGESQNNPLTITPSTTTNQDGGLSISASASATATLTPSAPTGKFSGGGGGKKRGGGGGGGKGSKSKRDFEPIDANLLAQNEAALKQVESQIEANISALDRARELTKFFGTEIGSVFRIEGIAASDYYDKLRREREDNFNAEIFDLERKKARAELILSKMKPGGSKDNQRDFDKAQADVTKLQSEIDLKKAELTKEQIKLNNEEFDSILEKAAATEELTRTLLELNNETRKVGDFDLSKEFDSKLEQNKLDLQGARRALEDAQFLSTDDPMKPILIERYQLLIKNLIKQQELIESIKQQKESQLDFNVGEEELNKILDKRQSALENLNRALEASGADEDASTKARRDLMKAYEGDIDKVIARLEFLATILKNPAAQKALESFKQQRSQDRTVPFSEKLRDVQRPLEDSLQSRDRRLADVETSGKSDIEKQLSRLAIIKETTAELLKQADAYVALAQQSGNPKIIADAEAARDAIRKMSLETQNFSTQLKNTAIDAFATGFNNFLQDLVSGSVSAGDALLNFAASFIQAIQQIIIQMLALMAIKAILKAFGIDIPISLGGAGAGGKKDGGTAASLRGFADGGNAYMGNTLIGSGGLIQGAGGPRSDSIMTYFPAAKTFGRTSDTEFILDAQTTKNVGISKLNALLSSKGRNFDRMFGLGFADGGAASGVSDAIGDSISQIGAPDLSGNPVNANFNQLNYIGKKSIEEVIADHGMSSDGDRLFVNQFTRNEGKIRARLGLKK